MQLKELTLYSEDLDRQMSFYGETMGLEVFRPEDDVLLIKLRDSLIRFVAAENATPYHFAINIPSTGIHEAHDWLESRVQIQPGPEGDIVDFSAWHAKSVYFYDADENIVELIARRNLEYSGERSFSSDDLIEVSEIGVACTDIESNYAFLHNTLNLEIFSGGFENFCAIGEEQLLFIVIDRNKKKWFPTDDPAHPSPFSCRIERSESIDRLVGIQFDGEELGILT